AGSMREIATRVGVSEPALYRHFPSKEALFLAIVRVGAGRMRDETVTLVEALRPESLRSQVLSVFADRRRAMRFYRPLLQTLLPAAVRNERFAAEYRATVIEPIRAALTRKVAELDDAFGVPANADATRLQRVRALISMVVGYLVTSFVLGDEADEAIVDAASRVMGWGDVG
ncbi:MAG: helix-turn-helix transcriptional regulator, partial [Actinobacteria bacterium]